MEAEPVKGRLHLGHFKYPLNGNSSLTVCILLGIFLYPFLLIVFHSDDEIHRNYRHSAYFTSIELSCAEVWRLYRGRGDVENRFKELKYDFGFDSFNLKDFYATEAALTFVMMAYNLMCIFRMFVLQEKTQRTHTSLRYRVFAIGAYFTKTKGRLILNIALHKKDDIGSTDFGIMILISQ